MQPVALIAFGKSILASFYIAAVLRTLGERWPDREYRVIVAHPDLFEACPYAVTVVPFGSERAKTWRVAEPSPVTSTGGKFVQLWRLSSEPDSLVRNPFGELHYVQVIAEDFGLPAPPREHVLPSQWCVPPETMPLISDRKPYVVIEPFGGLDAMFLANAAWSRQEWAWLIRTLQQRGLRAVHAVHADDNESVLPADYRVPIVSAQQLYSLIADECCVGVVGHHGGATTMALALGRPSVALLSGAFDRFLWGWPGTWNVRYAGALIGDVLVGSISRHSTITCVPPHPGCGGCGCAYGCRYHVEGVSQCMSAISLHLVVSEFLRCQREVSRDAG